MMIGNEYNIFERYVAKLIEVDIAIHGILLSNIMIETFQVQDDWCIGNIVYDIDLCDHKSHTNFERIPKKIMKKFNPRMKRVKLDDIQYQNDDPCKAIFDNSFAENGICINIQDYIKYIDSTGVVRSTKYLPKSMNPKDLYEICTNYTMIQIMGSEEKCKKKLEEITKRIVRGITNA